MLHSMDYCSVHDLPCVFICECQVFVWCAHVVRIASGYGAHINIMWCHNLVLAIRMHLCDWMRQTLLEEGNVGTWFDERA